jgi:hypothetical protein
MKKQLLTCVMLLAAIGFGYAQDSGSQSGGDGNFAPSAGDISASFLFGRGNYQTSGLNVPSSPYYFGSSYIWKVGGTSPYLNTIEANSNDVANIVGAEARYFITNNIAAKLSGGAIIRNTPSVGNLPGYIDPNVNSAAWVPYYSAVPADNQVDANINIGGEYQFTTKYSRLFPWVGVNVPFYYGRRSLYDATIDDTLDPSDPLYIVDIGVRHAELWGFGLQAAAGFDYYIAEGLYFGFEIKPISYVYSGSAIYPGPGLDSQQAKTTTWSFFAQPFVKFGIRF